MKNWGGFSQPAKLSIKPPLTTSTGGVAIGLEQGKRTQRDRICYHGGIAFENYEDIRAGDTIECFRVEGIKRTL